MNSAVAVLVVLDTIGLIVLAVLLAGVLRYLGGIRLQLEATTPKVSGLVQGDSMPDFSLVSTSGVRVRRDDVFGAGQRTMIFVLNDQCDACEIVGRQVAELAERPGGLVATGHRFVLAWLGSEASFWEKMDAANFDDSLLTILPDPDGQIARALIVSSFPVGMQMDREGKLLSQSANPGPTWMYVTLGVSAPERPIKLDDRRWTSTLRTRG